MADFKLQANAYSCGAVACYNYFLYKYNVPLDIKKLNKQLNCSKKWGVEFKPIMNLLNLKTRQTLPIKKPFILYTEDTEEGHYTFGHVVGNCVWLHNWWDKKSKDRYKYMHLLVSRDRFERKLEEMVNVRYFV